MTIDPLTLTLAGLLNDIYYDLPAAGPDCVMIWQSPDKACRMYHKLVDETDTFFAPGTVNFAGWVQDFNPMEVPDSYAPEIGPVHAPTLRDVRSCLPVMMALLNGRPCRLVDHSLGARVGFVMHAAMKSLGIPPLLGLHMEPPLAGGPGLINYLAGENIIATQTYNEEGSDIVTNVPVNGPTWRQWSPLLRLQVPNSFSIADKHRMTGVLTGMQAPIAA
jgi:hypothetical protein